jgi:predicted DNA-binding transcriptional regulator AlpA
MTILNLQEAADFLRMSKVQVYGLCRSRSRARMNHPMPVLRINSNLRFSKESLVEWLQKIEQETV